MSMKYRVVVRASRVKYDLSCTHVLQPVIFDKAVMILVSSLLCGCLQRQWVRAQARTAEW